MNLNDPIIKTFVDSFSSVLDDLSGPAYVDHVNTDEKVTVSIPLPGFERDEIKVQVRDDILTVNASCCPARRGQRPVRVERRIIPSFIESEVSAKLKNGVLTVVFPKAKPPEGRNIPVT